MTALNIKPDVFDVINMRHYPLGNGQRINKYAVRSVYLLKGKSIIWNDICDSIIEAVDKVHLMQKKYTTDK